jgi:putative acetyltransferase
MHKGVKMQIRDERAADALAIRTLTEDAFAPKDYSDGSEGAIIDALRSRGALHLSLVAVEGVGIVGHVAFSLVTVGTTDSTNDGAWFGLGPVAVCGPRQKQGIGTALITAGLTRLRAQGARGVVVLGDPGYYGRFGFESVDTLWYGSGPSPYFQRRVLNGPDARGQVSYDAAFGDS